VTVAPEKHALFQYSRRHDSAPVDALLPGYAGCLVAGAHAVDDRLYRNGSQPSAHPRGVLTNLVCPVRARFASLLVEDVVKQDWNGLARGLPFLRALFAVQRSVHLGSSRDIPVARSTAAIPPSQNSASAPAQSRRHHGRRSCRSHPLRRSTYS